LVPVLGTGRAPQPHRNPVGSPGDALTIGDVELAEVSPARRSEARGTRETSGCVRAHRRARSWARWEGRNVAEAHTLFVEGGYGKQLTEAREISYRGSRLGIETEATALLTDTARFPQDAWIEICDRERGEQVASRE
jgi:hypothetical protein